MSPRLRRNWEGSCGTLRTLVYLATYCAFERIDELACVATLLAILLLENSSPVHPANFRQGSRQLAELPSCVSRMSPNRPPTSRRLPERTSRNFARQIPCTPALPASAIVCLLIRDDRVEASPALPSARLRAPGSHLGSPRPGSRFPTVRGFAGASPGANLGSGRGSIDNAANFVCKKPRHQPEEDDD